MKIIDRLPTQEILDIVSLEQYNDLYQLLPEVNKTDLALFDLMLTYAEEEKKNTVVIPANIDSTEKIVEWLKEKKNS
jgi:hypothetical protein